jgi:hypothetical protein
MTRKKAVGRSAIVAGFILAAALLSQPAALARTPFDGLWSVLIITDVGECDRAYRYALSIRDGRIYYDVDPSFDISGRVRANGQVSVSLRRGQQQASGTGRLYGNSGAGRWSGRSPTMQCSGHWEAERRG